MIRIEVDEEKHICLSCGDFYSFTIKGKCTWCSSKERLKESPSNKKKLKEKPFMNKLKSFRLCYRGQIVATFDVEVAKGILIPGFSLVSGKSGLFVSEPQAKIGRTWKKLVILSSEVRDTLRDITVERVNKQYQLDRKDTPPSTRKQRDQEYIDWKKRKFSGQRT